MDNPLATFKQKLLKLLVLPIKLFHLNYLALKQFASGKRQYIKRTEASYMGDDFATVHYVAFKNDDLFKRSYTNAFINVDERDRKTIENLDIQWRVHIVTWAAKQAIKLEGDFVECGVWWGFLSRAICEYVGFNEYKEKKFYLFDTQGDPLLGDLNHKNYREDLYSKVKERFKIFKNVELIRGVVPEVLDSVPLGKVAYLSIDMNGALAERKTLEILYDRVVSGGIIYFDDYGWDYSELRKEVDDFLQDKPETLLHFPSGNSVLVKI